MKEAIRYPRQRVTDKFRGAGGQSVSQPKAPSEADDTLKATQYCIMLDLLSEGPISGLADRNWNSIDGPNSPGTNKGEAVWFDQCPLVSNGSLNFNGVLVDERWGNSWQGPMAGSVMAEDTVSLGIQVMWNQQYTIAIDDPQTTRCGVGIRVPALQYQDSKGNINGYSVRVHFFVSLNNGGFVDYGTYVISGKCSTDYVREYDIWLPRSSAPDLDSWQILVERDSTDDADSKHESQTIIDYYTRIVDATLVYPYSAYVSTQINAEQLSSIPVRSFRVQGLMIQVPTNYFPNAVYGGGRYTRAWWNGGDTGAVQPWNGQFYLAFSNNPAWTFYDMATSDRYGAGEYLGTNVDKWALYQIAQYCDQGVPNGHGQLEPRFTCNTYIQTQNQAFKVLSDLASIFRGALYWGQGIVIPVADMPKPVMHSFTNANCVDSRFTYQDSEIKNRHSDATVTWNDPDDFFNTKIETVFDTEQRMLYGFRESKFTAFGCSSRGQARRAGLYVLATDKYETETVTFQTGLEAMYLRPGDIIGIVDNDRIGLRQGGRVKSISGHNVTLDAAIAAFPDGQEIFFYNAQDTTDPSDSFGDSNLAAQMHQPMMWQGYIYRMAGHGSQTIYVANGSNPPPPNVGPGTIFVIGANVNTPLLIPQATFRIMSLAEKSPQIYEIVAVTYEEGKYNLVDFGISFQPPLLTRIPAITFVLPPNNLTAVLEVTNTGNSSQQSLTVTIILNWEQPPDPAIRSYKVSVAPPGQSYVWIGETTATTWTYLPLTPGLYKFRVSSVNHADIVSNPATVSITVPDLSLVKPHRVSGLELQLEGNKTNYFGTDPVLAWRINSPSKSYQINSEEPYGANSGTYDPYFLAFQICVYDTQTNDLGWTDNTLETQYQVTYAKNQAAWADGKARHALKITVQALNTYNVVDPPTYIYIDNPPPDPPTNVLVSFGGSHATLGWQNAPEPDIEQLIVYMGPDATFAHAIKQAEISARATTWTSLPLVSGVYYFFLTSVDSFGTESVPTTPVKLTV